MAQNPVTIVGLREVRREFGRIGPEFTAELKQLNFEVADHVREKAQGRARRVGPMSQAAGGGTGLGRAYQQAFDNMTASKTVGSARIRLGGARRPYATGLEFGSKGGRNKRQFPTWRGNQHVSGGWPGRGVGYVVHPTIVEEQDNIVRTYERGLDRIADRAFGRTGRIAA